MKIAIHGTTRSGSTKLSGVISSMLGLTDHGELLNTTESISDKIVLKAALDALKNEDNFCVKILFFSDQIEWDMFDVILTTSRNPVDSFVSWEAALYNDSKFTYYNEDSDGSLGYFMIPTRSIFKWKPFGTNLLETHVTKKTSKPIVNFSYDEICDDAILIEKIKSLGLPIVNENPKIKTKPTNFNYKEKCINYEFIESLYKETIASHVAEVHKGWERLGLFWKTEAKQKRDILIDQYKKNVIRHINIEKNRKYKVPFKFNYLHKKHIFDRIVLDRIQRVRFYMLIQNQKWLEFKYKLKISFLLLKNIIR